MIGKRRLEQLLAAAVFDDLTPAEDAELTRRLAKNPALAVELESLKRFATDLPNTPQPFEGNLLPAIHAQIAAGGAPSYTPAWGRLTGFAVAAACVAGLFGAVLMQSANPGAGESVRMTESGPGVETELSRILASAQELRANGDAAGAYLLLTEGVGEHPDDVYAAEAQLAVATLAFEDLQWYSEAEGAFDSFARDYTTAYLMHPDSAEITFRRNLLAEARGNGYEPLYALIDAGPSLRELERILARHPAGFIATQAAEQMLAAVPDAANNVEALEEVRRQCSDPVALAHLDIELAERYAEDLGDGVRARALLEDVARRPGSQYAKLATERLLGLSAE